MQALRAFEATARERSLTRAAESLHVTHGAISHQIKSLESDLGVRLVERAGRGVRLTEEGERFAAHVRTAFAELMTAVQEIATRANPRQLRVSIAPSLASRWLLPRIGRFHARHPDIDLVVSSSMAIVDFQRDDADVAIRYGFGDWPGVRVEHLLDDAFFPVCSPRIAGGVPKRPADLARYTLLRADDEPWKPWFEAAGLDWPEPTRGPVFSDSALLMQAAAEGQGIALGRTLPARQRRAQRGAGPALRDRDSRRTPGVPRLSAAHRGLAEARRVPRVAAGGDRRRPEGGWRAAGVRSPSIAEGRPGERRAQATLTRRGTQGRQPIPGSRVEWDIGHRGEDMRHFVAPVLVALLSACATMHGPQTITVSTTEIESQDPGRSRRRDGDVQGRRRTHRPEVSLMPLSERLLLEWNFTLPDGPAGSPLGVSVELSGKPALNAARDGIDLTQVRIEDVTLAGLPRFLGLARLGDRKGMTLPDLPLMALPADRLRQSDVAYEATGVGVGFTGLNIDIVPR